jgi:deoxyhypusine synthase
MSKTSFGGRGLGEALDVLEAMVLDPDCHVVGTFSGAMTVAKMGRLLCTMLDRGWIDTVVSTGALMAHGFIESIGLKHYKYDPFTLDDSSLFSRGFNRVYDTLEPERNMAQAEEVLHGVMQRIPEGSRLSSASLCRAIGAYLEDHYPGPGILKSAHAQGVPVFIPAFTDSELALDLASFILAHNPQAISEAEGSCELGLEFNPFYDLFEYTRRACGAKRLGIFTIGGGVPRNWAQQIAPFVEIVNQKVQGLDLPLRRFRYAVRICPEPVHWGGLSGCSYQEGISWGKFVAPKDGGRFAEVHCDATIAWPMLIKGLEDRLGKSRANAQSAVRPQTKD